MKEFGELTKKGNKYKEITVTKLLEPMYVNGCDITNQKYHICRQLIKK